MRLRRNAVFANLALIGLILANPAFGLRLGIEINNLQAGDGQ